MLGKLARHDISSLRKCVSAGETLPKATFEAWQRRPASKILDGIGATEMMHIFIGSPEREMRAGATGRVVPATRRGCRRRRAARFRPARSGAWRCAGRPAAAISPTRARRKYVQNGWNVTGDTYLMDADGYFWYQARSDDMIISAGYNIAGPEVESGAADASGGRRMRRGRRRRRGARADREGLCGAARRDTTAMPR